MGNAEFPIIEQGLLYFWQSSLSSKYCETESLRSRQFDIGQIFFYWFCAVLESLTPDNILVDRPKEEPYCSTKRCQNLIIQHLCNELLIVCFETG
jgi:hypothetical protein